jgi:hypothetical protein
MAFIPGNNGSASNPLDGLRGRTDGVAAGAGIVGEYMISSLQVGSAITLTTAVAANIATITLTPGEWLIAAVAGYRTDTTTSITALTSAISKVSGALPATTASAVPNGDEFRTHYSVPASVPGANASNMLNIPAYRVLVTTNTPFYLVSQGTFTVAALIGFGSIWATRSR